jgi:hypothetical protein
MFPSFEGVLAICNHHMPERIVANQVQCELSTFYNSIIQRTAANPKLVLKDKIEKKATITLVLQTDTTGSVQYLGIDLNKVGLSGLAPLIAASNKTPSLQAKFQGKGTVKTQLDYVVDISTRVPCSGENSTIFTKLFLAEWLIEYFMENYDVHQDRSICTKTLTLLTNFQIAVDTSAGVNPFPGTPIILPVSGVTVDLNPAITHQLQIAIPLVYDKRVCPTPQGMAPAGVPMQKI